MMVLVFKLLYLCPDGTGKKKECTGWNVFDYVACFSETACSVDEVNGGKTSLGDGHCQYNGCHQRPGILGQWQSDGVYS